MDDNNNYNYEVGGMQQLDIIVSDRANKVFGDLCERWNMNCSNAMTVTLERIGKGNGIKGVEI